LGAERKLVVGSGSGEVLDADVGVGGVSGEIAAVTDEADFAQAGGNCSSIVSIKAGSDEAGEVG
jgi:hypothetical protein